MEWFSLLQHSHSAEERVTLASVSACVCPWAHMVNKGTWQSAELHLMSHGKSDTRSTMCDVITRRGLSVGDVICR